MQTLETIHKNNTKYYQMPKTKEITNNLAPVLTRKVIAKTIWELFLESPEFYTTVFDRYFVTDNAVDFQWDYEAESPLTTFSKKITADKIKILEDLHNILLNLKKNVPTLFKQIQLLLGKLFKRNLQTHYVEQKKNGKAETELLSLLANPRLDDFASYIAPDINPSLCQLISEYLDWTTNTEQFGIDVLTSILKDYYEYMFNAQGVEHNFKQDIEMENRIINICIPFIFTEYGYDLDDLNIRVYQMLYPGSEIPVPLTSHFKAHVRQSLECDEKSSDILIKLIINLAGSIYVQHYLDKIGKMDRQIPADWNELDGLYWILHRYEEKAPNPFFRIVRKAAARKCDGPPTISRDIEEANAGDNQRAEKTCTIVDKVALIFDKETEESVSSRVEKSLEAIRWIQEKIKSQRQLNTLEAKQEIAFLAQAYRNAYLEYLKNIKNLSTYPFYETPPIFMPSLLEDPDSMLLLLIKNGYHVNDVGLKFTEDRTTHPLTWISGIYFSVVTKVVGEIYIYQDYAGTTGKAYQILCKEQMKSLQKFAESFCNFVAYKLSKITKEHSTPEDIQNAKIEFIKSALSWLEHEAKSSKILLMDVFNITRKTMQECLVPEYQEQRRKAMDDEQIKFSNSSDRYCFALDENPGRFVGQVLVMLAKWLELLLIQYDITEKSCFEKYFQHGDDYLPYASRDETIDHEIERAIEQLRRLTVHIPGMQTHLEQVLKTPELIRSATGNSRPRPFIV